MDNSRPSSANGENLMRLRIAAVLGLTVSLLLATLGDARAQDVLWVPRSQLFAAVLGQQIGQTLAQVMNAYALGKARKEELEAVRAEIAKCGDNCSDELKQALKQHEHADAVLGSVIEDVSIKSGMGFKGLDWVKSLLGVEPPKIIAEQKAWKDAQNAQNIVKSYRYTVSDLLPDRQERCVSDHPTDVAMSLDKLMANMCTDKISKETGMDLRNLAFQFDPDRNVVRKYN
jgi:hypothetical protein